LQGPFREESGQARSIPAEHHFHRRVSDGFACDDAEAGDENGDSQDEQQQSEGTLLEMAEEPIEVDLILRRLVDEPLEQIRGVNLLHDDGSACNWRSSGGRRI
jgi:hypothetical protein